MSKYMKSYHHNIDVLSKVYDKKQHDLDKLVKINDKKGEKKLQYKINTLSTELENIAYKIELLETRV